MPHPAPKTDLIFALLGSQNSGAAPSSLEDWAYPQPTLPLSWVSCPRCSRLEGPGCALLWPNFYSVLEFPLSPSFSLLGGNYLLKCIHNLLIYLFTNYIKHLLCARHYSKGWTYQETKRAELVHCRADVLLDVCRVSRLWQEEEIGTFLGKATER